MGDYYQIIVDPEASEEEAENLASSIIEWLIAEGIIERTQTDCVLGSDLGFPPGPNCMKAVEADSSDHFVELWTNGLEVYTGRTVFYHTGEETYLICTACERRAELSDEWNDAVMEWYEGKGPGMLPCPHCGAERAVTEWQYYPPWGFGCLGFKFWNWPLLDPSFIETLANKLGHRVLLVEGKL
jgi:RNA polymerase subunit RPABC4/transcription elongation factor Spt4